MLYKVVLVSTVQQCESAVRIHVSPPSWALFPLSHWNPLGPHKGLSWDPCAPQMLPTSYFTHVCVCVCVCVCAVSSVMSDSATPWTVAHQAPPSMGFSRQEYRIALLCSPPGNLPVPGIEPMSHVSLAGRFFTTEPQWKPIFHIVVYICHFWEHFIDVSSWTQIPPQYAVSVTEIISSRARTMEVKTGWNSRSLTFYIFLV